MSFFWSSFGIFLREIMCPKSTPRPHIYRNSARNGYRAKGCIFQPLGHLSMQPLRPESDSKRAECLWHRGLTEQCEACFNNVYVISIWQQPIMFWSMWWCSKVRDALVLKVRSQSNIFSSIVLVQCLYFCLKPVLNKRDKSNADALTCDFRCIG